MRYRHPGVKYKWLSNDWATTYLVQIYVMLVFMRLKWDVVPIITHLIDPENI